MKTCWGNFEDYDVVRAKKDLTRDVLRGTEGTVLIIHQATPPVYEIEFMDEEGNSIGLLTVIEQDIERVEEQP
jgi:hypothetical protein